MRAVLLGSLRRYGRRYLTAGIAVMVAVGFLVAVDALTSSAKEGLTADVAVPFQDAEVVAAQLSGADATTAMARAERAGAEASVLGWTPQPVRAGDRLLGSDVDLGVVSASDRFRWQELRTGRFPQRTGEAVIDVNQAKTHRLELGDELSIGTGATTREVRVVGIVDTPSIFVAAAVYLLWDDLRPWADQLYVDSLLWAQGTSTSAQIDQLARWFPDAEVQPRDQHVEALKVEIDQGVDVLALIGLLFVAIAVCVAVLVIANTFAIIFAQRARDLALLRCVGATRGQLLRSVRIEALAIGLTASALGVALGVAGGYGLVAAINGVSDSFTMGAVSWNPVWIGSAALLGTLTTVVAAWLPTRRVVRVRPLQALRPEAAQPVADRAGLIRVGCGLLLAGTGSVALGWAVRDQQFELMLAGGIAVFAGVIALGPVLAPALIRVLGGALARLGGAPVRLATSNAVRNPRRSASTTAALLIGLTLTSAVLTGLATARGAVGEEMDRSDPVDVAITASTAEPLSTELVAAIGRQSDVLAVDALRGVQVRSPQLGRIDVAVAGPRTPRAADVVTPDDTTLLVPVDLVPDDGLPAKVTLRTTEGSVRLRTEIGDGWGPTALISAAALARLSSEPSTRAVWVRAQDGADAEDLTGDLTAVAASEDAAVTSALSKRGYVDLQLDVVTGAIVGLLGISVVIALVGIAGTLGLSVLERTREHAMLRAIGLTRKGLRLLLAVEAALLSVTATVIGVALGLAFAWVAVRAVVEPAVPGVTMTWPVGQLLTVVAISALAGLASCVLPARRATRITPIAGLAQE
ncbi:ABC transporter permease [Nocardioides sp. Bht2]|uniref:ABC transporter permease n=1 Tax=Nocardioides sp. Bht2 TaxID=3392297 RepID=UPI0039B6A0E3